MHSAAAKSEEGFSGGFEGVEGKRKDKVHWQEAQRQFRKLDVEYGDAMCGMPCVRCHVVKWDIHPLLSGVIASLDFCKRHILSQFK